MKFHPSSQFAVQHSGNAQCVAVRSFRAERVVPSDLGFVIGSSSLRCRPCTTVFLPRQSQLSAPTSPPMDTLGFLRRRIASIQYGILTCSANVHCGRVLLKHLLRGPFSFGSRALSREAVSKVATGWRTRGQIRRKNASPLTSLCPPLHLRVK